MAAETGIPPGYRTDPGISRSRSGVPADRAVGGLVAETPERSRAMTSSRQMPQHLFRPARYPGRSAALVRHRCLPRSILPARAVILAIAQDARR